MSDAPSVRLGCQGQIVGLYPDRCKECNKPIKGVICDGCETVEGWDDE